MNSVTQGAELYQGKAKTVYACDIPGHCIMEFRDDTSAFNGVKLEKLPRKGEINNAFNAFIMQYLEHAGIATHFEKILSPQQSLVKKLEMIPVECVVRNVAAGNLSRRLGIPERQLLNPPLFEFYYKSDALNDPMINDYHIITFGWATLNEITLLKQLSFEINEALIPLFEKSNMTLVDYKLEFGRFDGQLILGDEFTPDGCRIWDKNTGESFDKDRFRKDLGQVTEHYEEAAKRLGVVLPN